MTDEKRVCPKCGATMRLVPESHWTLRDLMTVDYICPNCLHVERVWVLHAEKGE